MQPTTLAEGDPLAPGTASSSAGRVLPQSADTVRTRYTIKSEQSAKSAHRQKISRHQRARQKIHRQPSAVISARVGRSSGRGRAVIGRARSAVKLTIGR